MFGDNCRTDSEPRESEICFSDLGDALRGDSSGLFAGNDDCLLFFDGFLGVDVPGW